MLTRCLGRGFKASFRLFFNFARSPYRLTVIYFTSTIQMGLSVPAGILISYRVQRLPIQEDETALVLLALWKDYTRHQVIELPQSLYNNLIRKGAAFLSQYMEHSLSLPKPSYDLWEERYGIWTYTVASVYGGLMAGAYFMELFGDYERSDHLRKTAAAIKEGMLTHLWDEESGRFARGLIQKDNRWVKDMTLESSMFGIWEFGVLPVDDSRVIRTMNAIKEGLSIRTGVGGVARYTNDYYFQQSGDIENVPGNPWIICTLWIANFQWNPPPALRILQNRRQTLQWVEEACALERGIAGAAQSDGRSPLSVAPLYLVTCNIRANCNPICGKIRAAKYC